MCLENLKLAQQRLGFAQTLELLFRILESAGVDAAARAVMFGRMDQVQHFMEQHILNRQTYGGCAGS